MCVTRGLNPSLHTHTRGGAGGSEPLDDLHELVRTVDVEAIRLCRPDPRGLVAEIDVEDLEERLLLEIVRLPDLVVTGPAHDKVDGIEVIDRGKEPLPISGGADNVVLVIEVGVFLPVLFEITGMAAQAVEGYLFFPVEAEPVKGLLPGAESRPGLPG